MGNCFELSPYNNLFKISFWGMIGGGGRLLSFEFQPHCFWTGELIRAFGGERHSFVCVVWSDYFRSACLAILVDVD